MIKKLEIYGRNEPVCKYCELAKNTLDERGIPYIFVDVNESEQALEKMKELGLETIPQLFLDGVHIGDSQASKTISLNRMVIKRDSSKTEFCADKINKMADWATIGTKAIWSGIVMKAMHKLPDGDVKTSQIQEALIQAALDFKQPEYNKVAGRLLLGEINGASLASKSFTEFYYQMVDDSYWRDMDYTSEEINLLEQEIDHSVDEGYGYPTLRQLSDKVMLRDADDHLLELPQYVYMGIAMSLHEKDSLEDVILYYKKASEQKINIPSPIMSTQRTNSNAGVSCVITTAGDSLMGIESSKHVAFMATAASAGLGVEYDVRSPKDDVRKGYAKAGGKLPHYKVLDKIVKETRQSNRGGSATVTFNVLDPEIETLLNLKLPRTIPEKRIELLDYTLNINNDFLRRAAKRQDWCIVSKRVMPELHEAFFNERHKFSELMDYALDNNIGKKVSAFDLFMQFADSRKETGRMYLFNIDNVNNHTPWKETVRLSNLCNEICLPTRPYNHITELYQPYSNMSGLTAQCFLGAIDVARVQYDEDYEEACYITLKSLDNLISNMNYPFPQFKESAKHYRSVGVGITNLAYCLAKNNKTYKDVDFIHNIAERHYYYLTKASIRLAMERGKFAGIDETKWADGWLPIDTYNKNMDSIVENNLRFDWEELRRNINLYGVRFSTLAAHMPCESSAVVTNSTNSVYPIRSNLVYKDSRKGKIQFFAPEVDKYTYDNAWDMDEYDLLNMYGIIQKFTDQSISADTYLDYSKYDNGKVPMSNIMKSLFYSMKIGMKTLYYLNSRTGRGEQEVEPESDCESCKM